MSTPLLGRNAVVLKGTQEIGYATGIRATIDVDLIKAFKLGSDKPAVLESGNKSFTVRIDKMYIDNAYATDVLNGAKVTIEVRPQGTGTGKPKITISNVVLTGWDLTIDQDGIIMESVEGEGDSLAFGTQA
jgi:hypothetical protein